jgi:hypothetical protein
MCKMPAMMMMEMENIFVWQIIQSEGCYLHNVYCTQPLQYPHSHERLPFYAHIRDQQFDTNATDNPVCWRDMTIT